jgi:hypothetical protein
MFSVGVYGLDLYSMYTSAHEVIHYLDETDPSAAKLARRRFEPSLSCPDIYSPATSMVQRTCSS